MESPLRVDSDDASCDNAALRVDSDSGDEEPHRGDTGDLLDKLLQRPCKCTGGQGVCFTQYKSSKAQIVETRQQFAHMPMLDQNLHLARLLGLDILPDSDHLMRDDISDGDVDLHISDTDCNSSNDNDLPASSSSIKGHGVPVGRRRIPSRKKMYSTALWGKQVCQHAFALLFGVSPRRINDLRAGKLQESAKVYCAKHPQTKQCLRSGSKFQYVIMFLWMIYHSVAEGMPDKYVLAFEERSDAAPVDEDDDDLVRLQQGLATLWSLPTSLFKLMATGPGNRPDGSWARRWIENQTPTTLWHEYLGLCEQLGYSHARCSFSTFSRILKHFVPSTLQFRKKSEHAKCTACVQLRLEMRNAKTQAERREAASIYSRHVVDQWLDRQFYWRVREISYRYFAGIGGRLAGAATNLSWLCCIIDGMDQAKFCVPRLRDRIVTKVFEKLNRPRLQVIGTWIHGFQLALLIALPTMPKTSEVVMECIARGLNRIYAKYHSLPKCLHFQFDNAPNNMKNQKMIRWGVVMVLFGIVKCVRLGYLRKGHTHEDIDAFFGQLSAILMRSEYNNIDELMEVLMRVSRSHSSRNEEGEKSSMAVHVFTERLDEVADWTTLYGRIDGVLKTIHNHNMPDSPHDFLICTRDDLEMHIAAVGCQLKDAEFTDFDKSWPRSDGDVFLVLRHYLADTIVQQILAVAPVAIAARATDLQPVGNIAKHEVEYSAQLRATTNQCYAQKVLTEEAMQFLLSYASDELPVEPRPHIYPWLSHRWSDDITAVTHREDRHYDGMNPKKMRRVRVAVAPNI